MVLLGAYLARLLQSNNHESDGELQYDKGIRIPLAEDDALVVNSATSKVLWESIYE